MQRRDFLSTALGAACATSFLARQAAARTIEAVSPTEAGYISTNGLQMYHEIYGSSGLPLVLIHGAFSAIGTSFGNLLPALAAERRIIAFEMQGHGRTADVDRPLDVKTMADDVLEALDALSIPEADIFGYSMGATVGLHLTLMAPDRVRKLVYMSSAFRSDGIQPGLMDGLAQMTPSMLYGTAFYEEYQAIAPHPENFDHLFEKKAAMDRVMKDFAEDQIRGIANPVLLLAGDSDLPTVEHMAHFHRLLGGGRFGDTPEGLPQSQLAILPGTSHISIVHRTDLVTPIVSAFLAES
jgi:pimeloyl-ACP methyl ester carboxylesterase